MLARASVELEAMSVADTARGQGRGTSVVDALVRAYTLQGYQAMLGGIHTHKRHLKPYYEADGFHVLGPGTPLDLQLPIGRLRYPAEPSMRHLVCPLAYHMAYQHGVLTGLLAPQMTWKNSRRTAPLGSAATSSTRRRRRPGPVAQRWIPAASSSRHSSPRRPGRAPQGPRTENPARGRTPQAETAHVPARLVNVGDALQPPAVAGAGVDPARLRRILLREGLSNDRCNSGSWGYWQAADRRPSKVMSKAFSAVFQRMVQRVWPLPGGSRDMIAM
ncbi:hypothetical protein SUDANB9_00109 [Streptomyces sp. enrichment culture]